MKIRFLLALAVLAFSFAFPVVAQQTADPKTIEQFDEFNKKFDEAFNNNDAAAVAAFFTEDAVQVTPEGPIYGREAIGKQFANLFTQIHVSEHINKTDRPPHAIGTAGNEVWRNGEWSFTLQGKSGGPIQLKGYWGAINVREGDTWKIRMLTFNVTPPPAAETK
jgi:ketosteroid isomerase-like protein